MNDHKNMLLRLLRVVEEFLRKKITIGTLRQTARYIREQLENEEENGKRN